MLQYYIGILIRLFCLIKNLHFNFCRLTNNNLIPKLNHEIIAVIFQNNSTQSCNQKIIFSLH